jgi:hypothetical protein
MAVILHKAMKVRKIKDDSLLILIFKNFKWIWSKLKGGYDHFMLKEYTSNLA